MRMTVAVLTIAVALSASAAGDFFIGDTAFTTDRPRRILGNIAAGTDGELFYLFADFAMNRLRPDGTLVDAEPFGMSEMREPVAAAYGRGMFLVTHRDDSDFFVSYGSATAITTSGEVLWSHQVVSGRAWPVYDGRNFLVLSRSGDKISGHVLDDAGFIVRSIEIADVDYNAHVGGPAVVQTDRGFVAVWRENDLVRSVLFDASGPVAPPVTIGTATSRNLGIDFHKTFTVASNGSGALALWLDFGPEDARPRRYAAQHLDAAGQPVGPRFEIVAEGASDGPELIWDGARYRAAWMSQIGGSFDLRTQTVAISASAPEAAAPEVASPVTSSTPALGAVQGRVMLAWSDYSRGGIRGKVANAGDSIAAADDRILRTQPYDAITPAAVWTGSHYVTAWFRAIGAAPSALVMRRFAGDGAALDAEPRVLASAFDSRYIGIATTGSETALVWTSQGGLYVMRVAQDGTPIDAEPLLVADTAAADGADVASDGQRFLIAWADGESVKARRLSARGGFVDAQPIEVSDRDAITTRLAFDGSRYVAAFHGAEIYAATISPGGSVSPTVLIGTEGGNDLAVATNGSTHLFVSGPVRVLTNRDLGDIRLQRDWHLSSSRAVWTGTLFVVAADGVIQWISPAGTIATTTIPVSTRLPENALATSGDGTALLVYTAESRSLRLSLRGRTIAPRRRAAGR